MRKILLFLTVFPSLVFGQMMTNNSTILNPVGAVSTEYRALITTTQNAGEQVPSYFIQSVQNITMSRFLEDGFHATADIYYPMVGDPNARYFAKLNWKNPAVFPLSESGTLTYDAGGFTSNGTTGYLNTGFSPGVNGVNYTQNNGGVIFHCSSYNIEDVGAAFGLRNAAGTSQMLGVVRSSAGAGNLTRIILNDNTNSDLATARTTRGPIFFKRINSTTKQINRLLVNSGNLAVASVARPSGDLFLLARNDISGGATNLFSINRAAFFSVGADMSDNNYQTGFAVPFKTLLHNSLTENYYTRSVTNPGGTKVVYTLGGGASWDSGSIFGAARYDNGTPEDITDDFDLYGGTDEGGGDPDNYSVGAFDYSTVYTGTKDAANPLIDISTLSPWTALLPMPTTLIKNDSIYWFASVRTGTGSIHNTCVFTSPISSPKTFTTPVEIITAGGADHFNHGFAIVQNHPDPLYWYAIYSHRNTSADLLRMNVIRCLKTADLRVAANWVIQHTNIVALRPNYVTGTNIGQVYNFCWYKNGTYHLVYGAFFTEIIQDSFGIFYTNSNDLSTFAHGSEVLSPTNSQVPNGADTGYTSLPWIDLVRNLFYYSGRESGSSSPYITRCVKKLFEK